jgi:hypothetical protein
LPRRNIPSPHAMFCLLVRPVLLTLIEFCISHSTIVIWDGDIGSAETSPPLFGNELGHDLVSRGALDQRRMDAQPELLPPGAPVLPIGVPHGVDAALCALQSSGETAQRQQRIGHKAQPPMVPDGFGTPPPSLVAAHRPCAVLRARCRRPPLPVQAEALGGGPGHPVWAQDASAACHRLRRNAPAASALAQTWAADGQRAAPGGLLADGDGALGRAGEQRHAVLDCAGGTRPLPWPAGDSG